jgi:hypothetical protein
MTATPLVLAAAFAGAAGGTFASVLFEWARHHRVPGDPPPEPPRVDEPEPEVPEPPTFLPEDWVRVASRYE